MANTGIVKDKYILAQSPKSTLKQIGEEIRVDLNLKPNPNLQAGIVYGKVTDASGNPLPNVLIKIMDNEHNPLAHVITGADGGYIFSPFPPGTNYHIYASLPGYQLAEGIPFTLLPQQQVEKNFSLVVDPSALLSIIAGDVINQQTLQPVSGAVVELYLVDALGNQTLISVNFTNEFGQYVFRDLVKGNYIIRINALGYKSETTSVLIDKNSEIAHVITNMQVNEQTARGTISGIITDNNNIPIPAADVILYKVEENQSLTPIGYTKTNTEGVYLFINVPKGDYKVKSNKSVVQ